MEKLEIILSLSATALGLIIATLTFLIKSIKNVKAKKVCQQIIDISNAIVPYIEQAEKLVSYSGAEKKEFVMTKANQYAIANHIKFDEQAIGDKIEELISLTKKVNAKNLLNPNYLTNIGTTNP